MTLKSREITSSTAFSTSSLQSVDSRFKMRDIFTFVRRSGLLSVRQSKVTHTYIFIYLPLRAKQVHKSDHTGWNVGQTDFSLKCIFKTLLGRVEPIIIYFASEPRLSMVEEAGLEHGAMSKHYRTPNPPLHFVSSLKGEVRILSSLS